MTLGEFIADIVNRLEAAAIEYMIGGSVASSIYGEYLQHWAADLGIAALLEDVLTPTG